MVGLGIHLHFVLKQFWSRHAKCYGTVGSDYWNDKTKRTVPCCGTLSGQIIGKF